MHILTQTIGVRKVENRIKTSYTVSGYWIYNNLTQRQSTMDKVRQSICGSQWHKWDLHFHTPSSSDYKNNAITDEDIINSLTSKNISAVVITDHNNIDKNRIENLQRLAADKLVVFPGIEIRTECGAGENIHIIGIFDEHVDIDAINNSFKHKGGIYHQKQNGRTEDEIYVNIDAAIEIIREFNGLVSIHAGRKSNGIDDVITNSLQVSQAIKTDIVHKIDIFEMGQERDMAEYKEKVFPNIGVYPMILCSDNHDARAYSPKADLWIKSDLTLEGLRQALCSCESRIQVKPSGAVPEESLYNIENVRLSVPDEVYIPLVDGKEDKFCFSGINQEVFLNKGLICIIGDRGTGKSVFLDLLAYKMGLSSINKKIKEKEDHIINKILNKQYKPTEFLAETKNTDQVEYYTQNEIESIARNYEITNIVRHRIQSPTLSDIEQRIQNKLACYISIINKNKQLLDTETEKNKLAIKQQHIEKIISGITDETYIDFNKQLRANILQRNNIQIEKDKYTKVILDLLRVVHHSDENKTGNYTPADPSSEYGMAYNAIFESLRTLLKEHTIPNGELFVPKEFESTEKRIQTINSDIIQIQDQLKEYLKLRGFENDENLTDKLILEQNKVILEEQINQCMIKISGLRSEIVSMKNTVTDIDNDIKAYQDALQDEFSSLSQKMVNIGGKESALINFELTFDYRTANKDFICWLDHRLQELKITERSFISELERRLIPHDSFISPKDIKKPEDYIEKLEKQDLKIVGYLSNYLTIYWDEFKTKYDEIYKNLVKYKQINILYNNKNILDCSFGQRATATIIILLSLGNTPIIIDEPESNLGEPVIYNELVKILKIIKSKRQIIFATHNANIVINGDSDQVIHLDKDSKITSFTIENIEQRSKLYALEGGAEAFLNREKRYKQE